MDEEENLLDTTNCSALKLECARVNYAIDDWDGEYGIPVKTKKPSTTQPKTTRKTRFIAHTDLIICIDIQICYNNNQIFSKIARRGDEENDAEALPPIHALWLVSIGSVEERAAIYFQSNEILFYSDQIAREENTWHTDSANQARKFYYAVAYNFKSWILSTGFNTASYQYRSTFLIPKSFHFGNTTTIDNQQDIINTTADNATCNLTRISRKFTDFR